MKMILTNLILLALVGAAYASDFFAFFESGYVLLFAAVIVFVLLLIALKLTWPKDKKENDDD